MEKITVLMISELNNEIKNLSLNSVQSLKPIIFLDNVNQKNILGTRKNNLISKVNSGWILLLDTDEIVSPKLAEEIKTILQKPTGEYHGYRIPYQNYVFGKPVYYGGERYAKVRLFLKKFGRVTTVPIHEEVVVDGKIGKLTGVIHHYSYRTPWQVLEKFTKYAWTVAGEKRKSNESVSVKKLVLYGPHMFWARAIQDEGWRDGWRGIVLAIFFGYMEAVTYWFLFYRKIVNV